MIVFCDQNDRIFVCSMMVRDCRIAPLSGVFRGLARSTAVHGRKRPVPAKAQAFRAHLAIRKISDAINERSAA
ncbi:hypothetical protein [Cupriavidus basilensis]|uniref:hypothetical protein n=1 Tax=Cupriavidus basilensis TaxID=68895 RepID=UPI001146974E|nr:hypothetical protein [Cupriavidus basilensis]